MAKQEYEVLSPVKFNKKRHEPGTSLELDEETAAPLLEAKAIKTAARDAAPLLEAKAIKTAAQDATLSRMGVRESVRASPDEKK